MKYLALGLLIVSSAVWTIAPSTTNAQTAQPTIAKGDPDFSIVLNSRHTSPLDGSHVPRFFQYLPPLMVLIAPATCRFMWMGRSTQSI